MTETKSVFYFYHNMQANPHITIHKSECGDCQNGKGKQLFVSKGLNAVWSGPFDNLKWAEDYINKNLKINYPITYCKHCIG